MVSTRSLRQRALSLALGLSTLLVACLSRAQDCPAPFEMPTAEQIASVVREKAVDRGFLWSIERNGVTSHLYGTLHLGQLAWTVPGPKLARALQGSKVLAMELDVSDPETVRELLASTRQDGASPLPDALQKRLRDAAAAECLPWEQLADQRPELQLSAITVAQARRDGLESAFGSEVVLSALANHLTLTTRSLETPQEQMAALSAATPAEQVQLVEAGLDLPPAKARRVMRQLAEAWASRDLARLETYTDWCECVNTPAERALSDRVLDQRNRVLAERIDGVHARHGSSLFAIGALHMVGPTGLTALLKAQGFTVKRVF